MNTQPSLQTTLDGVGRSGRIGFADVRRLQRTVLAEGIGSRAEAELLIALDGSLRRRDPAWTKVLVAAVVDFVVWAERPTGVVDESTARWLQALLTETPRTTARCIAREIAKEAQAFENDALAALKTVGQRRPPARRHPADAASAAPCQPAA